MCPQYNAQTLCSFLVEKKGLQFFCGVEVINYMQYDFYAIVNCIKILQKNNAYTKFSALKCEL